MIAYKSEVTVDANGSITLKNLPFPSGESLEVILVKKQSTHHTPTQRHTLQGTVTTYSDPFEPVALEDWTALT